MGYMDRVSTGVVGHDLGIDPNPAPGGPADAADDADSLIPDPGGHFWALSTGGDPGVEIAKLVLEAAHEDKKMSKEIRQLEERAQERAEDAQLKALEHEADAKLLSGVVSGAGMVAGGAAAARGDEAMGKVLEGSGKLLSAFPEHDAGMTRVESTHQEQLAGRHKRASEDARDAANDASELVDRTIAFYKEYVTAKSDAQKAAICRA
jgi:hypothetical protein